MQIKLLVFLLTLFLGLVSCKKDDPTFTAIKVPKAESVLEGRWTLLFAQADGNARIGNGTFPVTGSNINNPDGYYDVRVGEGDEENTYSYDLKVLLNLVIGEKSTITREYNYNDKDAGTWILNSEEQLTFYANQGNVEKVFFTRYDSAEVQHMQISIPIDTVLENIDYTGNIILDMIKNQ